MFNRLVRYFLENRPVTYLFLLTVLIAGLAFSPFNWKTGWIPRDPVPVDAIPDIGENQQIVATEWMGRSPKDIQEQVTYPLSSVLSGIPGVKTIRSTSMFGMSFIYIIFKDNIEFYWSRSRILEKMNSLPAGTLPQGVQPTLGPDATGLGQIFWYTLEGRNPKTGKPNGGWNPQELRTLQDFYVKYSLSSAEGVSEIASIGGFVREYQVDIDPEALKAYGVSVMDVMNAVQQSNLDIGAETMELNQVEYLIRGLGYIKNIQDLDNAVVTARNNVPVRIKDVARTTFGPATRRGGLDKGGSEAVGAAVVARYGSNPMAVIDHVKDKIKEIEAGLPQKTLADGSISKVAIVPFYDRSGLIRETIGSLESALAHEVLISIIVILVLVLNLKSSLIVAGLLPLGVLFTFILMRLFGVEANIVALSGIAIAIGIMVDIGIVDVENILRHLEKPENQGIRGKKLMHVIYQATTEVRAAVVTSISTTIVSFLPVFALEAAEGKLFHPLAYTKTFALVAAFILGIVVLPTLVYLFFNVRIQIGKFRYYANYLLAAAGIVLVFILHSPLMLVLTAIAVNQLLANRWRKEREKWPSYINIGILVVAATFWLSREWLPLGAHKNTLTNFLFVGGIIFIVLGSLMLVVRYYNPIMRWAFTNKWKFLLVPTLTLIFGILIWKNTGKEFLPSLNEGSFLLMPTSMPHSSIEQNLKYAEILDKRLAAIPEVEMAVGKWGRVNSALDPAPVQMFENTVNYRSEFILDGDGHRMRFKTNNSGAYILKNGGLYVPETEHYRPLTSDSLVLDRNGEFFRQWRPNIRKPDDIWNDIVRVTHLPGLTSAPKLQPIETRLIMLSTGMRAPMGLKVFGPDLASIEKAGLLFEQALKEVPSVIPSSVFYDRTVGAPYVEIELNREAMARYGMRVNDVQNVLQAAVGGMVLSTSVEGRERFPIRVRYVRERRDNPEELKNILIPTMEGTQIPLGEIANIDFSRGAQMIRSENTFLVGYIIFDKENGKAEVDVVEQASRLLQEKVSSEKIQLPKGVTWKFAGNYEQQQRATQKLAIVIPISLMLIFLLLFFQFRTMTASLIHFSGVFVAFVGGFILIWLYGQDWFLNFNIAGINMRDLFQIHPIHLSVAVWVGFIALFGIATNDGVLMGTYIHQVFEDKQPKTVQEVRDAVISAGQRRVRPAMMTTAVAIIALLPVLTSTGKGADIMVPMAIPTFGGMVIQVMTIFVVPLFQSIWRERVVRMNNETKTNDDETL
jgi:copper/silver efflux system protein